jgi:uncharacterized protein (DUF58 family)
MLPASFSQNFLKQLEMLKVKSRKAFLGHRQGGHISLKRGHGLEFSDYRKYELGDHPRYIDWGVYARSDKLFVKRFQEEQDLSVLILLDSSASMLTPGDEGKWERAKDLAIALSYIALMQQDNVVVSSLGSFVSPHYYGVKCIHDLSQRLSQVSLNKEVNLLKEVYRAASEIRFPGIAIIISDFLFPLNLLRETISLLRSRNLDITAVQVLGNADIKPWTDANSIIAVDSETEEEFPISFTPSVQAEYSEELASHINNVKDCLRENRVSYALTTLDIELGEFILNELPKTGLLV